MTRSTSGAIRARPTGNDQFLLTPGPLTTSLAVKQAMLRDWGSRDTAFVALNRDIRERLVNLANGDEAFTCVPLQGSGTFAVEAMLGTLVPKSGRLLVLVNGAYGERMMKIMRYMGRDAEALTCAEDRTPDLSSLDALLGASPEISHVAAVHCETTSGILNPLDEIAAITARHGRRLLIDAMSAFGAIPLDITALGAEAVVASSNKCLEGVPGMAFAIIRRDALEAAAGNAHSLALDLHDQWQAMEGNGQWRFTPPTHVLAAFHKAITEHARQGGIEGRNRRYRQNCATLVEGMRALGFETLLDDEVQSPIIVTFKMPADPRFLFEEFYRRLAARGYVIYPGKLTVAPSFRIGCIGHIDRDDIAAALQAITETLREMNVTRCGPPQPA